jgi:hypothetical protein
MCCNFNLRAEAGEILSLKLSNTGLTCADKAAQEELAQQLRKFSALTQLDVSANPGLDRGSVSIIFKALSGKTCLYLFQTRSYAHTFFFNALMFFQAPQSLLNSTSEALASTACPKKSHNTRPISRSWFSTTASS